jgi:FkbM family methyltransferase
MSDVAPLASVDRRILQAQLDPDRQAGRLGPLLEIEHALIRAVAPLVPERHAVDIGAHHGAYTRLFRSLGFDVTAVEAVPSLVAKLRKQFAGDERVTIVQTAASSEDGRAQFHLASRGPVEGVNDDPNLFNSITDHASQGYLSFDTRLNVATRSVRSMMESGLLPERLGILKVDTEGHDRSVLAGALPKLGRLNLCEYWSNTHTWGDERFPNEPSNYVDLLKSEGDHQFIVLGRDTRSNQMFFQVDASFCVPGSWGNVVFTVDEDLHRAALAWCLDVFGASGLRT